MKAKIKATGEIINIADYATITLNKCDSWGNPIEVRPEDIELIRDITENEHWQNVREKAAIVALHSVISTSSASPTVVAKDVVEYADALIKELKGK